MAPKLRVVHGNKREIEAFEFYWAQDERNMSEVARRFKVHEKTVRGWAKRNGWAKQVEDRDAELAAKLKQRSVDKVADSTEKMLALCTGVYARFSAWLTKGYDKDGNAIPGEEPNNIYPKDFVAVAKLELLLRGQPTERGEQTVFNLMQDALNEYDQNYQGDGA